MNQPPPPPPDCCRTKRLLGGGTCRYQPHQKKESPNFPAFIITLSLLPPTSVHTSLLHYIALHCIKKKKHKTSPFIRLPGHGNILFHLFHLHLHLHLSHSHTGTEHSRTKGIRQVSRVRATSAVIHSVERTIPPLADASFRPEACENCRLGSWDGQVDGIVGRSRGRGV